MISKALLHVVGTAQDGGFPHLGCTAKCCKIAWDNNNLHRLPTSIALIDKLKNKYWLFDATPRIKEQLHILDKYKLSQEQIDKANIYFYIIYQLSLIDVPLLPDYKEKSSGDKQFWFGLIDNIKKYNYADDYFYKMIEKQIKDKNRHTIDLDLLKYPNLSF